MPELKPGPVGVARLAAERVGWLCTLRSDGSPHLTPVWFFHTESTLWVATSAWTVKARNVSRDARVSFALPDGDAPLVAEGLATVVTVDVPVEVVAGFAAKYGWSITDPGPDGHPPVLMRIPVRRWLMVGTAR